MIRTLSPWRAAIAAGILGFATFCFVPQVHAASTTLDVSPTTSTVNTAQEYTFTFTTTSGLNFHDAVYIHLPRGTTFESGISDSDISVDYSADGSSWTAATISNAHFRTDLTPPSIDFSFDTYGASAGYHIRVKVGTEVGQKKIVNTTVEGVAAFYESDTTDSGLSNKTYITLTGSLNSSFAPASTTTSTANSFTTYMNAATSLSAGNVIMIKMPAGTFSGFGSLNAQDITITVAGSPRTVADLDLNNMGGYTGTDDRVIAMANQDGEDFIGIILGTSISSGTQIAIHVGGATHTITNSATAGSYVISAEQNDGNMEGNPVVYGGANFLLQLSAAAGGGGASVPEYPTYLLLGVAAIGFYTLRTKLNA